jgi:hypothetical protein
VYNTQGKWMESFKVNANGSIALGQDWSAGLYMITNGEESIHLIKE